MKIQLPNREKIILEDNLSLEDKMKLVLSLVNEWRDVCLENWSSNAVKYFLDSLSSYLLWHKNNDDKDKKNNGILSRYKLLMMNRRTDEKRKELPIGNFSKLECFVHNYNETKKLKAEIKAELERSKTEAGEVKVWKNQPD